VDSIRDLVDVDSSGLGKRPVVIWFVDCNDSIIQHRLITRSKKGEKKARTSSPVDHTALAIREQADRIIPNNDSLEDLRWRVDDVLFETMTLRTA
jgi:dephospho-CoA kinase